MTSEKYLSYSDLCRARELKWRHAPPGMSPEMANKFFDEIKAGKTVRMLTAGGKKFGPTMVSLPRFKVHCRLHPEWAREVWALSEKNGRLLKRWRKGKHAAFCKRGLHAMVGENVVTSRVHDTRYCKACWLARARRPMTAEEVTAAKQALSERWTTRKITNGIPIGGGPKNRSIAIVTASIFFAQCKRDPELARLVKRATERNVRRGQHIRYSRIRTVAVRDSNNDYYKIREMIPASNPHRDDIVARIFEDMLSEKLARENVRERIKDYVAEFNRMFPIKFAKFGDSALVSLDEVLFDDGSATRGDTVSRGLWD
jgi:hypothetical protein